MPEVLDLDNPGVLLLPVHDGEQLDVADIRDLAHLHSCLVEEVGELILAEGLLLNLGLGSDDGVRVDEFEGGEDGLLEFKF